MTTLSSSKRISLLEKSAPIVGLNCSENVLCSNIYISEVLPTDESPITTTLTKCLSLRSAAESLDDTESRRLFLLF